VSAFDYASQSGVWAGEMVPGATHYWRWDVTQSKLLNGTDGGAYAPTRPVCVGGAGVFVDAAVCTLSGGVTTKTGGRLWLNGNGSWDVPSLYPERSFERTLSLLTVSPADVAPAGFPSVTVAPSVIPYQRAPDDYVKVQAPTGGAPCGMTALASQLTFATPKGCLIGGNAPGTTLAGLLGSNAQLASVTLTFRAAAPTSQSLPTYPPVLTNPFSAYGAGQPVLLDVLPTGHGSPTAPQGLRSMFLQSKLALWRASTAYTSGQYVIPATQVQAPISYFRCLSISGNSGVSEPIWNITPGANTSDNGVTWQCIGPVGMWAPTSADAYYLDGAAQSVTLALDPAANEVVDISQGGLAVQISNLPTDGSLLLHSLQFTFNHVTAWVWM